MKTPLGDKRERKKEKKGYRNNSLPKKIEYSMLKYIRRYSAQHNIHRFANGKENKLQQTSAINA